MGGGLEHQALMVHHTSPCSVSRVVDLHLDTVSQGDRPNLYISQSSSRHACRSDNRPTVKDSQVVDRPTQQSTTSWMHRWSGRASLSSRLDNMDLTESTLTTDGYMWTRSSRFYGSWLDLEAINSRPLGSLSSSDQVQYIMEISRSNMHCDVLITVHFA
jgi:hypothetical protein